MESNTVTKSQCCANHPHSATECPHDKAHPHDENFHRETAEKNDIVHQADEQHHEHEQEQKQEEEKRHKVREIDFKAN